MDEQMEITLEEGQKAMEAHARERGYRLHLKYQVIDAKNLSEVLCDSDFVRYPTSLAFDSNKIQNGLFALAEKRFDEDKPRYVIYVHESFRARLDVLPHVVLYHLATVNYGDFATDEAALELGSSALNCDKEDYYRILCEIADGLEKNV